MSMQHYAIVLLLWGQSVLAADPVVRYVKHGDHTVAAVVPAAAGLLHTRQMLSTDSDAGILFRQVEQLVSTFGGDPRQLVKVNVVASTPEIADAARAALTHAPASFVVGALPHGEKIGIDVIAVAGEKPPLRFLSAAYLPKGPRLYVSGQAEKGVTPADAAAKTIGSLLKTLGSFGATKDDIVQAKCFLTPMAAASDVVAEFEKVFGELRVPPLVFVEWTSDLPIEIELIAAAPPAAADAPAVEYLTPPGMKPSPLFARVVRINRGDIVYTSGLYSKEPGSGEQQILSIFEQLQDVLKRTGSDLRHLAKATYYVGDADASKQLNEIRPRFYDPARPPAASKAMVAGAGMKDRSIGIDIIGVVVPGPSTNTIKP